MSEKIIATVTGYPENRDLRHIPVECVPDRNAPSVSEIVEVLKVSKAHVEQARKCFKEHEAHAANAWASRGMLQHIDYLITRLEDT